MLKDVSKLTEAEQQIESQIEAKRRTDNCMVDIQNVLKRWNCVIDPVITLSGQGIVNAGFRVVAIDQTRIS
jgi:hypothetical protein